MDPFVERPEKQEQQPTLQLVLEERSETQDDRKRRYIRIAARCGHTILSLFVLAGVCFNSNSPIYQAVESDDNLTVIIFVAMVVVPFTFYYVASLLNPGYVPIVAEEVRCSLTPSIYTELFFSNRSTPSIKYLPIVTQCI
eukprot:sb/3474325/